MKYHHERWDGKGYPEGLKGEEIPLLGRVLGVADFLDALTSDRSYRKGLSLEEALQMVKDLEGKAFDPVVVKAAVELHEKGELALPTTPNPDVTTSRCASAPDTGGCAPSARPACRPEALASRFTIGGSIDPDLPLVGAAALS